MPPVTRPNILHIVADDLGHADFSHLGAPVRTPNLDRFAAESLALERFYVCPVCSPTRTALLTGVYPHRLGLGGSPMQYDENKGLPPDRPTLPEILGRAGYAHRHAIGKWHLGNSATCFHPVRRGFTSFYGHYCGAIDYWTHERAGELDWHRGLAADHTPGYSTRLMADDAVRFIRDTPADAPWQLYLAFNAVHTPIQAPEETIRSYDGADLRGYHQTYCAMVTEMDAAVGRVLAALEARGLRDNTLVIFHSDNGGCAHDGLGSNAPLRAGKGTVYEGGVRVRAWMRWPARWRAGARCDAVIGHVDLLPTLAGLAGAPLPDGIDGRDALPWLDGAPQSEDRLLYVDRDGVVSRRWKLVGEQLFDLEQDPSETRDVAAERPAEHARLRAQLAAFQAQAGQPYLPPGLPVKKDKVPREWAMLEIDGPSMGEP